MISFWEIFDNKSAAFFVCPDRKVTTCILFGLSPPHRWNELCQLQHSQWLQVQPCTLWPRESWTLIAYWPSYSGQWRYVWAIRSAHNITVTIGESNCIVGLPFIYLIPSPSWKSAAKEIVIVVPLYATNVKMYPRSFQCYHLNGSMCLPIFSIPNHLSWSQSQ